MFDQSEEQKLEANGHGGWAAGYLYGSRLFLKFFIWFWLIGLATAVCVGFYAYHFHLVPEMKFMDQVHLESLKENAGYMAESYEKEGPEGAATFALKDLEWFFDEKLNNILEKVSTFPGKHSVDDFPGPESFFQRGNRGSGPGAGLGLGLSRWRRADVTGHGPPSRRIEDRRNEERAYRSFISGSNQKITDFVKKVFTAGSDESFEIDDFHFQACLVVSKSGKKYVAVRHLPWKRMKKQWFMMRRILEIMPLFLLVSALICFSLGKYMAKPIVELREASRNFASGNFSVRVDSGTENRYDEIGDLASDFNLMANRLELMINGQHKLLGDISHELRSPLARLQVALEILEMKSADTNKEMISRMSLEISRLNDLIGKVLEINRIGSHQPAIEKVEINLDSVIGKICEDGRFEGLPKKIDVLYSSPGEVKICANAELIEQAVENILRNAIKYSPENSTIAVNLVLGEKSQNLKIVVSDCGPGIPEEHLTRIFEPFFRCHDDRDRKTGGVGLGLAIASQAIVAHNGIIRLINIPTGGLRAEISLPKA